jgi:nicotinate-nucleotide adenylyltransferase
MAISANKPSASQRPVIGIFGGTFDPIHNGHLQMAQDAYRELALDEVRLVPCHRPVHRDEPYLTSEQRLELLSIATAEYEGLLVDDRELKREQLSYTVDTLRSLRQELGEHASLVFILGDDAYVGLNSWHQWQELRQLAHLLVMGRPQTMAIEPPLREPLLKEWLENSDSVDVVRKKPFGGLMQLSKNLLGVSSTQVRQQLMEQGVSDDVPPKVLDVIQENCWYQNT